MAAQSIQSLHQFHDWPVVVIGDQVDGAKHIPFPRVDAGGRWAKLNLTNLSPFEYTLYIDADTLVRGDLSAGFDILSDGWDAAIVPSQQQGPELLWHVTVEERQATLNELEYEPLQLQGGMMFYQNNEAMSRFFSAWRFEWLRWRGADQGALLRALAQCPLRLWLLGYPWNSGVGTIVSHHFGRAKSAH
jgi:hypothetical protein